jgi:general secretion pathway protein D
MNKYNIHLCFLLMLTCVSITTTGSRKHRRDKKKATKASSSRRNKPDFAKASSGRRVNTHMNVEAYQQEQEDNRTKMMRATTASTTTGLPSAFAKAIEDKHMHQYADPLVQPHVPAAPDMSTQPIQIPPAPITEEDEEDNIELNFENAGLENFAKQIEDIFEITLITDDAINPLPQGKKAIKNNKISFKTNQPLSKKETWNLFVTFLDLAGFAIIPQADPKVFRISTIESARKAALPTFIGVDPATLPDTDELIRYVYFLENASTDTVMGIVNPLRSASSQGLIELKEHKGFILTDKAYNIKMLMAIITELDKVSIPESMSILKLRNADAKQVQDLYKELLPKEEPQSRFFTKKQPTSLFFPENTRMIADPRTNTLILLGPSNSIKKIEQFIMKYIDVELDQAYSPLYTYQLKYADAETIADIMSKVTAFGQETEAGKFGGVRGEDQYMQPMAFIPEKETNKLIIKGHYEDYLKAQKVIAQLDARQPQAAIEVLIATIDLTDTKSLGAQIRSKEPGPNGLLGNNIKFQTSGLYGTSGIVANPDPTTGTNRLLGNLVNLVTGAVPGTSLLTLGQDPFGVWGIFQALQTVTDAEVVSNPFILATNNAKSTVKIGEERRIVTAQVVAGGTNQNAFDADDANLEVTITPHINSDGMINLAIKITINEFTNLLDQTDATQNTREIYTNAIVANKEVLALGGLIRNDTEYVESKVPILGDIPILGWFFKNKKKTVTKNSLLVLISTRIIESLKGEDMQAYNRDYLADYQATIDAMDYVTSQQDPIDRLFFRDKALRAQGSVEGLIFERHQKKQEEEKEQAAEEKPAAPEQTPEPLLRQGSEGQAKKEVVAQAHNKLIEKMHSKKRTQLALTDFLNDKEVST